MKLQRGTICVSIVYLFYVLYKGRIKKSLLIQFYHLFVFHWDMTKESGGECRNRRGGTLFFSSIADEDQAIFGGRSYYTTISDDVTMAS